MANNLNIKIPPAEQRAKNSLDAKNQTEFGIIRRSRNKKGWFAGGVTASKRRGVAR